LSVRIPSGRIELAKGETGVVKVTVVTKDPDFVVEQRGDLIDVYSDAEGRWNGSKRAEVYAELPPGSHATLRCASADIGSTVELGKAEIKSASGDIDIDTAEKVIIKTASGDATIGFVAQALRFNSASGDLRVQQEVHGSVVVSTASGDVHIDDTDAVLEINTVSGDVFIDRYTGKSAAVKTMSGSVDVGIPSGTKVDLDVSLLSGKVRLPPKTDTVTTDRRMSLKMKSVSGSLTINRI
jgi:DUF4097 and DUF4098 domain-containing protein YvlB